MGVMSLRRMVMAQMAGGVEYVSGTFTVPDSKNIYTLNFGKTFVNYLYIIEMTDESKTTLLASGIDNIKTFCTYGRYPLPEIGNVALSGSKFANIRANPSSGAVSSSFNSTPITSIDGSSISFNSGSLLGGGAYVLYKGYTYKYFICEIK